MVFDLYFAGSQCEEADNLIIERRGCRLFSYLNDQSNIKKYLNNPKFNSKMIIDSGAFTAWTKGININVDQYINWLNERAEKLYLYGQLDVIPGERNRAATLIEVEEACKATWENYLYMRDKLINKDGLLYTFHIGEPFSYLTQALNWMDPEGKKLKYIALGGMVGKPKTMREEFLEKCFELINSSTNPNVKIHAFGMTDFELLQKFPIHSADSTSWIMTGSTGGIMTDMGVITVSTAADNKKDYFKNLSTNHQKTLENYVNFLGFDLESLSTDYKKRMCFNITYLMNKSQNLERGKISLIKRGKLF